MECNLFKASRHWRVDVVLQRQSMDFITVCPGMLLGADQQSQDYSSSSGCRSISIQTPEQHWVWRQTSIGGAVCLPPVRQDRLGLGRGSIQKCYAEQGSIRGPGDHNSQSAT